MFEIPSDIYRQFVEQKIELEKNKKDVDDIKEEMQKFREEMNARPVRQENTVPIIVGQHYGFSDFSQFQSMQGGPSSFKGHANNHFQYGVPQPNFQTPIQSQPGSSDWQRQMPEQSASHYWQPSPQPGSYYSFGQVPSHMGRPNLQTTIETQHDVDGIVDQNILNRGKRQQLPSKYLVTPFTVQPLTIMVPKQCVSKTKNKGKKAKLSPMNLGGVFEGYNKEENNVMFLGSQFTSNILFYENVDPAKVRRGNYENVLNFLNNPYEIYLDCYMRGYIVPVTFWQELAPHLCMPDMQRLSYGTPIGWLGGEHMNSWMELMIRRRPLNANWTVAYTSTISVHPENNQFIILKDPHIIGTLDGFTRPFPSWNYVNWVFLPIHVAGNHWATGVIHLANSHFYVFDSMFIEENNNVISQLIECWTPVLNHILEEHGCLNETRRPHNFQYSYNQDAYTFPMSHVVPLSFQAGACSLSTLYWLKIPHYRLELWMVLETNMDSMKLLEKKLFTTTTSKNWKICKAYTREDYATNMNTLQIVQPDAHEKLCRAGPQRWSRAHCPLVRYNYMTSNSVESVNACSVIYRKEPVLKLAETYRAMVQECKQSGKKRMKSATWVVNGVNAYQYEVSDGQYIREVNLQTGICGCRKWQLSGLPCGHVIAITRFLGLTDCVHYAADWFKKPKYQATYSESIHSLGNMQQWEFPENIQKAIPPRMDNPQPGRPKNTNRILCNTPKLGRSGIWVRGVLLQDQ
ncbi:phospholipase-like protein [Tanacetum coccineum]